MVFYTLLVEINEYSLSQKLGYVFSGNDYLVKNSKGVKFCVYLYNEKTRGLIMSLFVRYYWFFVFSFFIFFKVYIYIH